MMFIEYNPNPKRKSVGDCVVRALTKVTGHDWNRIFLELMVEGLDMADMPSSNAVWGSYLQKVGFLKRVIPNECPNCYLVRHFCIDHPIGTFVLGTGNHVVAVIDGDYYDSWDSGDEVPIYYFERRK